MSKKGAVKTASAPAAGARAMGRSVSAVPDSNTLNIGK